MTTDNTQHTAGPWTFSEEADGAFTIIAFPPDLIIAECFAGDMGEPIAAEANAKLICAAPDLLEALRAFSKAFQPSLHRNGEQTAAIIGARYLLAGLDA